MAKKILLHVFLSRRSHHQDELEELVKSIREKNEQPDSRFEIKLRYSEADLLQDDNSAPC